MHPSAYNITKIAYSVNELREVVPLGRTRIYELVAAGLLKATKVGRRTMFLAPDVVALLITLQASGGDQ